MTNFWDDAVALYHGFSISIGGLIFGYYSGIIIGLLFIQDNFQSLIYEAILNTGFLCGILGIVFSSWGNDFLGRKRSILLADALILSGGVLIFFEHFLLGKLLLGFGVGLISSTSPLYISEISIPKLRDGLICTNSCLLFAIGKLLSFYLGYHVNLPEPAKTNFMMAVACIPAPFQFILVLVSVPESPAWLCIVDKKVDAVEALRIIYSDDGDVVKEINALELSLKDENNTVHEIGYHNGVSRFPFMKTLKCSVVRTQLAYGVSLQIVQQVVGINALMYCIPFITTMWGVKGFIIPIHDHITCRKFTLLNVYGSYNVAAAIYSVCFQRAHDRKKFFKFTLRLCLYLICGLSFIFMVAPSRPTPFWENNTSYNLKAFADSGTLASLRHDGLPQEQDVPPGAVSWDCLACMKTITGSMPWFRADKRDVKYHIEPYFPNGSLKACPRDAYWLYAVMILCSYIFFWSAGLETIPWTVNSEIYLIKHKGLCGAVATMANWISFLTVSLLFFNLIRFLGPLFALMVQCAFTYYGEKFINSFV